MKVEELLQPIDGDDPAGAACVYDLDFQKITELADLLSLRAELEELKRQTRGPFTGENAPADEAMAKASLQSAEDRVRMLSIRVKELFGKEIDGSRLPTEIESLCSTMLKQRGKDLRVVVPLTVASMKSRGLGGLLQGLALFEGLLRTFDSGVHPRPDEDDERNGDDSVRSMVYGELVSSPGATSVLRETVLLDTRAGRLAMRDAEVLDSVLPADPGGASVTGDEHFLALVRHDVAAQAGKEAERVSGEEIRERLRQLHTELTAADETLRRIAASFRQKAVGQARLQTLLGRMASRVGKHFDDLVAREAMAHVDQLVAPAGPPDSAASALAAGLSAATPVRVAATAAPSRPANREQIRLQVLELAALVEQLEPSHPAPLFLRRAARLLAAKSFYDIVTDMVPDSLSQIETLTGQPKPEI